jgi:lipoprotein
MKLFKKLAAAALAAVLALSMVGCGAGGTGIGDITGAVKDYLADQIKMSYGITVEHKDELDTLAEKLIREANEASKADENKDKTVLQLVTNPVVIKAAGIENAQNYRFVLVKSTFTSNYFNDHKVDGIGDSLMNQLHRYDPKEYGLANGKIGGTEYVLMLVKDPTQNSENM